MFTALIPANTANAMKLISLARLTKVHITVLTAGRTVNFGQSRSDIESPPPFAGTAGLQINDTQGTIEIELMGDLWARSNTNQTAYIQFDAS